MSLQSIPQRLPLIEAITPQAGDAITGAYISLKNAHRALVLVHINQANAATVAISIEQATAVAGTGSKVITNVVPIWANQDCVASDALVKQTDAVNFTTSAAVKHKLVVFQIDPETLDMANGFDCITVKTGGSNAANITSAVYLLEPRYAQATPPSAIID